MAELEALRAAVGAAVTALGDAGTWAEPNIIGTQLTTTSSRAALVPAYAVTTNRG